MFDKQTVLILGAGASCHYGYPTGEELVERIIEKIKELEKLFDVMPQLTLNFFHSIPYYIGLKPHRDRFDLRNAFRECVKFFQKKDSEELIPKKPKEILQQYMLTLRDDVVCDFSLYMEEFLTPSEDLFGGLRQLLESLHPLNIDSFLLYNDRYAPLAKTLIADILLECKLPKPPEGYDPEKWKKDNNWYRYLFHALTYGCKVDANDTSGKPDIKDSIKNLTIITFNYDTSLERYLWEAFGKVEAFQHRTVELMELIEKNIHHVYGKLADEDFYDLSPDQQKAKRSDIVRASAKNIDVIAGKKHQELRDDCQSTLQKLDNVIKQGGRLVILGYGFDPENNKLIGLTPPTGGYILHQTNPNLRFSYTNFRDSQRIERKFAPDKQNQALREPWRFEKSTKTVAEALQQDFDLT